MLLGTAVLQQKINHLLLKVEQTEHVILFSFLFLYLIFFFSLYFEIAYMIILFSLCVSSDTPLITSGTTRSYVRLE